jgi:hypothetical protein
MRHPVPTALPLLANRRHAVEAGRAVRGAAHGDNKAGRHRGFGFQFPIQVAKMSETRSQPPVDPTTNRGWYPTHTTFFFRLHKMLGCCVCAAPPSHQQCHEPAVAAGGGLPATDAQPASPRQSQMRPEEATGAGTFFQPRQAEGCQWEGNPSCGVVGGVSQPRATPAPDRPQAPGAIGCTASGIEPADGVQGSIGGPDGVTDGPLSSRLLAGSPGKSTGKSPNPGKSPTKPEGQPGQAGFGALGTGGHRYQPHPGHLPPAPVGWPQPGVSHGVRGAGGDGWEGVAVTGRGLGSWLGVAFFPFLRFFFSLVSF